MYPGHRGVPAPAASGSRLDELLNQVRNEFDSQLRQAESFEHQGMLMLCACDGGQLAKYRNSAIASQRDAIDPREGVCDGADSPVFEAEVSRTP